MNGPPLPANLSAKRTRRPAQNLASLAQEPEEQFCFRSHSNFRVTIVDGVKRTDDPVKKARISSCTVCFTRVLHLPHRLNGGKQMQLGQRDAKKRRKLNTETGGSDPTFSAFSRPKSSWGRSRPFFAPEKQSKSPENPRVAPVFGGALVKHDDPTEFCIKACMAGPQKGKSKCQC